MVYVADTATVDGTVKLLDSARVEEYAVVEDYSTLYDSASVSGYAFVNGCCLQNSASVSGHAVIDYSNISDNAQVYGNAKLLEIILKGNVHVFGNAVLNCNHLDFRVTLAGSCKFGGNATFEGLNTPEDFVEKYGKGKVKVIRDRVTVTDVWDMG